jgi:hypothetical protein
MATIARALKPSQILGGDGGEIVDAVSNQKGKQPGYVLVTMPDVKSARNYAEFIREIAQLLPPALEHAQKWRFEQIVDVLSANIPNLPSGALAEARMLAQAREHLLGNGQFVTAEQIANLAGYSKSNPSAQPAKWRQDRAIFAVKQKGTNYFPLFALNPDDNYRPYKAVAEILHILRETSISDWGIASWFMAVNSFLDNKKPKDLLASDPRLVIDAARDEATEGIYG